MEEEVGKKVTRLRRRLSVESDDVKSPATPLTPSKKRGGRLAAKPQLELIDENAADISPRNTKKPVGKKVDLDEKAVTPSRRSARIRSNTSLLSDTPTLEAAEDRGTPARRSTRVKSNTSLVSEAIQNVDSPRAKRSARRMSQAGSDNEAPVTPARSVRRTRKTSTTSIDNTVEPNAVSSEALIKEVIEEETDKPVTPKPVTPKVESPVRKSPRLNRSNVNKQTNENKENKPATNISIKEDQIEEQDNAKLNESTGNTNQNNLSVSSSNLLKQLASEPQKSSLANKSTSNLDDSSCEKGKRHRTKSWTTISSSPTNDTCFSSDTEFVRKKNKKKNSIGNMSGSGDGLMNASIKSNKDRSEKQKDTLDSSKLDELNKSSTQTINVSQTEKYFEKAPSTVTQPLVYIDDSDSNSAVNEKVNKELDSEDQCVPVVQHNLNDEKPEAVNLSYEPMDIDETMPTFIEKNDSIRLGSKELNISLNKSNKSPRKSFTESITNKSIGQINSPKSDIQSMVNNYDETNVKSKRKSSLIDNDIIAESLSPKVNRVSLDISNKSFTKSIDTSANKDEVDASLKSKRKSSISKDLNLSQEDEKINLSQANNTSMQGANSSTLSQGSNKKSNKSKLSISQDNQQINSPKKSIEENLNQSKRKSSIKDDVQEDSIKINKSLNKSQRKSLASQNNESQNTTTNANKSILVISQLKDDSALEENANESKDLQSNTANISKKDNKNISLTYSTSTPLQQKSLKKLGAINTSIIVNSASKVGKKDKLAVSQKESSDDDTSEDSEEESLEKSKFIDDEVDEASDDYESGDSRDDEEREYEDENEIKERGETLESEEDLSNDEDYEKDSFIVSSDAEDNELLSGSGDDLSMSADELTMSAKSKKKYNERKAKEQKKASKEMFESRHKSRSLNESTELSKPKKQNRQRLDSSDSELDEDVVPSKKNNRQRIDSSQDISGAKSDAEISISKKKKKKAKRLSESVCENGEINEKEITITNNTLTDKIDPLNMQNVVKKEPKTPQKDFDISTVAVTNVENIEEIDIDENVSMVNTNQIDPLQNTVAQDDDDVNGEDDDDDEGSISENEEITQNYESVLSNLNIVKKVKAHDTSLNLNKKVKQTKEPIVDELNLTQVKQSKKKRLDSASSLEKKNLNNPKNEKSAKTNKSVVVDEDSSDSIDMKLLFPEDSNDSESININNKKAKDNQAKDDDAFIPLKRSEAKTNMLEDNDKTKSDETVLNVSKKKNKRKSGATQDSIIMDAPDENLSFFIDTTGTHETENIDTNTSIKNRSKKKKGKNSISFSNNDEENSNDAPLEVSSKQIVENSFSNINTPNNDDNDVTNKSMKKKNKKKLNNSTNNETQNASLMNESLKDKKARNNSTNDEEIYDLHTTIMESTKKKNKKARKNSLKEVESDNLETISADIQDTQVLDNSRTKKNRSLNSSKIIDTVIVDTAEPNTTEKPSKKRKRNTSANQTVDEIIAKDLGDQSLTLKEQEQTKSINKKIKIAQNEDITSQESTTHINKKNKKKNKTAELHQQHGIDNETKKNKKRKEREDDDGVKISKISKQNSFDKLHVPRLPSDILNQLDDKAPEVSAKAKAISTTSFTVETAKKRKNKPSNYLEESIYLNDSIDEQRPKGVLRNPKVLPFTPTVATLDYGFTTNFNVNIIPKQTQFIAQSSGIKNFKNEYLQKAIKKLGTFEKYKKHRNVKLSKF